MPKLTNLNELKRKNRLIKGRWQLDDLHQLSYQSEDQDEQFEFETSLIAAEAGALVFSVTEKQKDGKRTMGLAKLTGRWRANEKNQLEFEVARRSGKSDVLTFTGTWKVGENHEIIYGYRTRSAKGKASKLHALTFKGYWDLTEKTRLTYLIEGDSESAFRFRGAFQSPSIFAKAGEIRYQIGIEAEGKREKIKTVTLFGKWKLSTKLELSFEIEYAGGEKREIRFGADYAFTKDLSVTAQLINRAGDPLGVEVVLNRSFLEDNAQAFVRLRKTLKESAVEAGVTIPW